MHVTTFSQVIEVLKVPGSSTFLEIIFLGDKPMMLERYKIKGLSTDATQNPQMSAQS